MLLLLSRAWSRGEPVQYLSEFVPSALELFGIPHAPNHIDADRRPEASGPRLTMQHARQALGAEFHQRVHGNKCDAVYR